LEKDQLVQAKVPEERKTFKIYPRHTKETRKKMTTEASKAFSSRRGPPCYSIQIQDRDSASSLKEHNRKPNHTCILSLRKD